MGRGVGGGCECFCASGGRSGPEPGEFATINFPLILGKFIADSMLGTLARRLRMLGIDTLYLRNAADSERKSLVRSQGRILLTKDSGLAGELADNAWLVKGADVREEFLSIAERLALFRGEIKPFSRCLVCNSLLEPIEPQRAENRVPPYVFLSRKTFSECYSCEKIFWEGTHGERMAKDVEWMREILEEGKGALE
ncbi:MAG: Mut7-C RNAse domain-containing protein [bacterium]|nr:Mut7-C RNAse domain-containing protein [bacterium]MDT8394883.1 Mut7-C RNAse domain-containing protein [bacterium]